MHFTLICRPDVTDVYQSPENQGYHYARFVETFERSVARGHSYEIIDTSDWSDQDRDRIYIDGGVAAAGNRYRVARVFGSNSNGGADFGWRVPALLVYNDRGDTYPADVYPHEFKDGRIETIAAFLASV
jgi:hypothetical protein